MTMTMMMNLLLLYCFILACLRLQDSIPTRTPTTTSTTVVCAFQHPQRQHSHHHHHLSARRPLGYRSPGLGDNERHSFLFPTDLIREGGGDDHTSSGHGSSGNNERNVASTRRRRPPPPPPQQQQQQGRNDQHQPSSSPSPPSPSSPSPHLNNRHSSSDWLYNLRTMPDSSVLKEIKSPVVALAGWSTFISLVYKFLLVTDRTVWASKITVPHAAHGFLVSSLGLLLVFRTNSAYQRFMEGRKIWEQIHTVSRNLSRLTKLYRNEVGSRRLVRIQHLIAAFPYLLRHHVRSDSLCSTRADEIPNRYKVVLTDPSTLPLVDSRYEGDHCCGGTTRVATDHAQPRGSGSSSGSGGGGGSSVRQCYVDRRDLPWSLLDHHHHDDDGTHHHPPPAPPSQHILRAVARASNRPLWVCDRLGQEIMGVSYSDNYSSRERLKFLSNVDKLANAIGQCERIHQTAVPLNYARHSLRSLTLWLLTLPFCLVQDMGLLTGPVTAAIAWLLFGVYQIGHSIEDPFQGSLRLSILCDAIRKDVLSEEVSAFNLGPPQEELVWNLTPRKLQVQEEQDSNHQQQPRRYPPTAPQHQDVGLFAESIYDSVFPKPTENILDVVDLIYLEGNGLKP